MVGALIRCGTLLALLTVAAPGVARGETTTPEFFVSEGNSTGAPENVPVWVPLEGARMTGAAVYRLGVRLQASTDSLKRAYVVVKSASSPQTPESGSVVVPGAGNCASIRGNAGDIVEWGTARYYGDGPYGLTAALADHAPGGCPTGGAVASGTFTVDARPAVTIVDARANDIRAPGPFRGVRVVPTTDGLLPEALCARDPVVQPDGSLKGSVVRKSDQLYLPEDASYGFLQGDAFPDSGSWACVARVMGGPDNLFSGWSTPVTATITGDFSVRFDRMLDPSFRTFAARFRVDRGAAGEVITFGLKSCGRYSRSPTGRKLGTRRLTLRATVSDRGTATVRLKYGGKYGQFGRYYVGRARFGGNALIPAGKSPRLFAFSEYVDSFDGPLLGVYDAEPCL